MASRSAPWPVVALAAVPGLLAALAATFPGMPIAAFLVAVMLMGAAGLFLAWRRRSAAAFPVWALVPLGLILFGFMMGTSGAVVARLGWVILIIAAAALLVAFVWAFRRARPAKPPAASWVLAAAGLAAWVLLGRYSEGILADYSWLLLAFPAAAGLLLAPTHGLPAALVLLYYGTFIMAFDVEHVIYFHDAPGWSDAIKTAMPLLLLVLLPVWVLRERTPAGQAVALVVPFVIYYLVLVAGLAAASAVAPDWEHVLRIARPVARLMAILAVVGAVYGWLWRREAGTDLRESTYFTDE